MSSYLKKLKNPKTGKMQIASCLDGYFGGREYGYGFRKDGGDINLNTTENERLDFYRFSELK